MHGSPRLVTQSYDRVNPQNQEILASSLQTAANLAVMPALVASLVADLTEAIELRIRATFDMATLAREMSGKGRTRSRMSETAFAEALLDRERFGCAFFCVQEPSSDRAD